jgi:2,5-diketo-D-gluconate reductase A
MNDGYEIPSIGYGTWMVPDAESEALVREALEAGYRHIDTAMIYENEVGVGKGIARSGLPREEIFVTTKLWITDMNDPQGALTTSLRKLQLDYVDLYLIHWPAPKVNLYAKAWDALIELREKGLVRSIGVSNFNPEHLDALKGSGVTPCINQVEAHPSFPNTEVITANTAQGILTECYCPLGRGKYLTSPVLSGIASHLDATEAQVVLAWHLSKGYIPLPKSATPARIKENLDVQKIELADEDIAAIDSLATGRKICADPADFNG